MQNPYAKLAQNSADTAQQPGMATSAGLNDEQFVGPPKPVQEDELTRARKKLLLQYLFGISGIRPKSPSTATHSKEESWRKQIRA
jgi:hypothetical protein